MSTETTAVSAAVREIPVAALDPAVLGNLLLKLPPASALLRHARLTSTLEYAGEGQEGQEAYIDFLYDILTEDTRSIVEKWYSDQVHATGIASATAAAEVASHRAS